MNAIAFATSKASWVRAVGGCFDFGLMNTNKY